MWLREYVTKGCNYRTQCRSYRFHASPGSLCRWATKKKASLPFLLIRARDRLAPSFLFFFFLETDRMSTGHPSAEPENRRHFPQMFPTNALLQPCSPPRRSAKINRVLPRAPVLRTFEPPISDAL